MQSPSDMTALKLRRIVADLEHLFQIPPAVAFATLLAAVIRLRHDAGVSIRLASIERELIEEALRRNNGNRRRTAAVLGISLRRLQYRLKDYSKAAPHM